MHVNRPTNHRIASATAQRIVLCAEPHGGPSSPESPASRRHGRLAHNRTNDVRREGEGDPVEHHLHGARLERTAAHRGKDELACVRPIALELAQHTLLTAAKMVITANPAFLAHDVEYPMFEVELVPLQLASLGHPEPMTVHQREQCFVAGTVPPFARRQDELIDPRPGSGAPAYVAVSQKLFA